MISKLSQNMRLVLASLIAGLIIFAWKHFYVDPMVEAARKEQSMIESVGGQSISKEVLQEHHVLERHDALAAENQRIKIKNGVIEGSINLKGARIDDLILTKYHQTLGEGSPKVILLSPAKSYGAHFVDFGWIGEGGRDLNLPDSNTLWRSDAKELVPGKDVTLEHTNSQGVRFVIKLSLDENYMFNIEQSVFNGSGAEIRLGNYSTISRVAGADGEQSAIIHEGGIGVSDGTLKEFGYEEISDDSKILMENSQWIGFSDKYWLSAIIHEQDNLQRGKFSVHSMHGVERFQASSNPLKAKAISQGATVIWPSSKVFLGAKELELLDFYEDKYSIKLFDRAVDFGALYFITKPIFELLHYLYNLVGNFGFAILLLTMLIKLLLFPLAHKGFKGMNRLKALQPKMMELKERYGDTPQEFQKRMIELYKKEKVNPMGGCLPILLQIPVFFALYKVLYVTIEMRHAPFIWWIHDLSAPDPLSVLNLFGLLPIQLPQFLMIGVFPIIMSITMYIQQKMNPEPADPTQAKVMKFFPLIFLFAFSSFPSGLVIYWSWSNVLSIAQQFWIKRLEKR